FQTLTQKSDTRHRNPIARIQTFDNLDLTTRGLANFYWTPANDLIRSNNPHDLLSRTLFVDSRYRHQDAITQDIRTAVVHGDGGRHARQCLQIGRSLHRGANLKRLR